jgi:hypothetical protein
VVHAHYPVPHDDPGGKGCVNNDDEACNSTCKKATQGIILTQTPVVSIRHVFPPPSWRQLYHAIPQLKLAESKRNSGSHGARYRFLRLTRGFGGCRCILTLRLESWNQSAGNAEASAGTYAVGTWDTSLVSSPASARRRCSAKLLLGVRVYRL